MAKTAVLGVHSISRRRGSNSTTVRVVANQYQTCWPTVLTVVLNKIFPNSSSKEREIFEKEEIPLLDEEEIDPETIHAAGYEGFDEAVKEFGYDADDLEDHWDENIAIPKQKLRLHTIEEWQMRKSSWMKKKHSQQ